MAEIANELIDFDACFFVKSKSVMTEKLEGVVMEELKGGHAFDIASWWAGWRGALLGASVNGFAAAIVTGVAIVRPNITGLPVASQCISSNLVFVLLAMVAGGFLSHTGFGALSRIYGHHAIAFHLTSTDYEAAQQEVAKRKQLPDCDTRRINAVTTGRIIQINSKTGPLYIWVDDKFGEGSDLSQRWGEAMVLAHESSGNHQWGMVLMVIPFVVLLAALIGFQDKSDRVLVALYASAANRSLSPPANVGVPVSETPHRNAALHALREYAAVSDVTLNGSDLTVPAIVAAARRHVPTCLSADPVVKWRVDGGVQLLTEIIKKGETVYGATTGFGGSADVQTDRFAALQRELIGFVGVGFGNSLPSDVVRAAMVVRANSNVKGYSGLRWEVIEKLLQILNKGLIPVVPSQGSITASGDLMPLAHIAMVLIGKADAVADFEGRRVSAMEGLKLIGVEPAVLGPKEGLALINGTSVACALAALNLQDAHLIGLLSQITTALSVESLLGSNQSYHPIIQSVKNHPGQIEVGRNLVHLLKGSLLARNELDGREKVMPGYLSQDRYSLRTAPQWLGPQLEVLLDAERMITHEMNSANDNPLVDVDGKMVLHGGNFQGTSVAVAMDHTRLALVRIGQLIFAQFTKLVNTAYNNGLTPNLAGSDDLSLDFGFKGTDILMGGYVSELRKLASPVAPYMVSAELDNQDVNSLGLLSARETQRAIELLQKMIATHLYLLAQAIDLRNIENSYRTEVRKAVHLAMTDTLARIAPDSAGTANEFAERIVQRVVEREMPFRYVNPASGRRYEPLMEAMDTELILFFQEGGHSFNVDLVPFLAEFRKTLVQYLDQLLPVARKKAIAEGGSSLLGNTRPIYSFVRNDLQILFVESNKQLGPQTERIFVTIHSGRIAGVLAQSFDETEASGISP